MKLKYYRNLVIVIAVTWTFSVSFSQECITPFNFSDWSMEGTPLGSWQISDSNVVTQVNYNFPATFYVSRQNMINVLIKGTMSVETSFDNDFIGIVFGYRKPTTIADDNEYNFFLFDWKSKAGSVSGYSADEGFRLSRYNGFISSTDQKKYFWGTKDEPPKRDLLKTKYGNTLGWQPGQKYEFELLYTSSLIRITIDDELIFERQGCFAAGRVGFYCMSQVFTRFEDFTYQSYIDFTPSPQSVCIGEEITFKSFDLGCSPLPDFIQSMNWDFGDGQTSTEVNPVHLYSEAGNYDVRLIISKTDNCNDTIIKSITIKPIPIFDLGNDTIAPACSSIIFDADNPGSIFSWSTGEVTQSIQLNIINRDTSVWVVVDKDGCIAGDSTNIEVELVQIELFFPNAFTPNGDGSNDLFAAIGETGDVSFFHMMIFNRWGQLVFETNEAQKGWDGNYKGKPSPYGVYIYKYNYSMGKFCSEIKEYSKTSTLTLLK